MRLVEIEFRGRRRVTYANPEQYPLVPEDAVIVQADRGIDLGIVNLVDDRFEEINRNNIEEGRDPESVLRLATPDDLEKLQENAEHEVEARKFFRDEVKRIGLEMKLVEVECQLDRRKLTFYFTADGRVDFRELVKSLAQQFHTRIDLRQIGARDESKRLGGIGICGRELCCSSWIREFKPVTTSMMKDQHMILNPQKNTGPCGKLRCCLRYEVDQYRDLNKLFPKIGTLVKGPRGRGKVNKFSYNWEHIGIEWEDGAKYSYGMEHLKEFTDWDPDSTEKPKLLTFRKDPSIEEQRKEEQEGELVARGDHRPNGDPRVSVRSKPKKGGGDGGACPSCGKDKSQKQQHANTKDRPEIVQVVPATPSSAGESADDDKKKPQRKSRRGGSRRRGRGNKPNDKAQAADGAKSGDEKQSDKPSRSRSKSRGRRGGKNADGSPKHEAQPRDKRKDGDDSQQNKGDGKSSRRRGGRGRNHRGGGDDKGSGGNPNASGSQGGKESRQSQPSGDGGKQGPSSQPSDGKPQGRPPRPRGRNRKR